jgi:hypothetical protein
MSEWEQIVFRALCFLFGGLAGYLTGYAHGLRRARKYFFRHFGTTNERKNDGPYRAKQNTTKTL